MTDRERIARALQSALGEPLSTVLDRVMKVVEEVRAEAVDVEREACAKLADDEMVYSDKKADEGRDVVPWVARRSCAREIAIDIRARGVN